MDIMTTAASVKNNGATNSKIASGQFIWSPSTLGINRRAMMLNPRNKHTQPPKRLILYQFSGDLYAAGKRMPYHRLGGIFPKISGSANTPINNPMIIKNIVPA